jgi:hypothetical protein
VRVLVKPAQSPDGSQSIALCWSEGRTEKDRAIRQKQEIRFLADIEKLGKRIALGRLRSAAKIYEAIGRLKERYPRVARYYHMVYEEQKSEFSWREDLERKQRAQSLDGSYLLKSSRNELSAEDIWRTYILLTRVEAAFRAMKSPCASDPSFIIWSDGLKLTSSSVCWPTTCWCASSAPSWNKVSTLPGKPCAVSSPLTKSLRCGSR